MQYSNAAMMYGLVDGEKTNVPFEIAENGNLGFNIGGEYVSYNDFEQPFSKDYKVASGILSQSADLYKNHTLLQGPQKDLLRLNLMASLRDPNTIKSLVSDFESDGLNLSDIPLDDIDAARNMIVDRIMNSYTDVAAKGKAEYDAKRADKNPGPANNSGYSASQKTALNRLGVVASNPNITITIPQQAGKWLYNSELQQFNKVDSDLQPVLDGDGTTHEISLKEYAKHTGLSLDDVKSNLGLN
jgi:hypothetical protein